MYCAYCGKVAHRCDCAKENSKLRQMLARRPDASFVPLWRESSYKRGVPPQIKAAERAIAKKNYKSWYAEVCASYGEVCANCGSSESLVLDHILSIAKGGKSTVDNLQLLCRECNRLKGKLWVDCRSDSSLFRSHLGHG
jgi:5-methylcytosine-specific restriction endonuclease McrA